jgi:hypothetical protein
MSKSTLKMQHCCYCGAELGIYEKYHGDLDTCGARECEREMHSMLQAERDEAHEQLDRDMGWDRF